MLPSFPDLSPVPLDGGPSLAAITRPFPPYSEFSHVGLWAYAIQQRIRIGMHGRNLVVRFDNSLSGRFSYSFVGADFPDGTAALLLGALRMQGCPPELRLIPEETARGLDRSRFDIEEDESYFDYVLDLEAVAEYRGRKFKQRRNHVNQFRAACSARVEELDLTRPDVAEAIGHLCKAWQNAKERRGEALAAHLWGPDDVRPLVRLLSGANHLALVAVGIWNGAELVAFLIAEIVHDGYAIAHFAKADTERYPGAFDVVMQEAARLLLAKECSRLNFQEDLGSPTLRFSKLLYRPVGFLKKFTIRERVAATSPRVKQPSCAT